MARNVGDLALLLSVHGRARPAGAAGARRPRVAFAPPVAGSLSGLRVALSVDLGGAFEVDHEVAAVVESAGRGARRRRRRGRPTPTRRCRRPRTRSARCGPGTSRRCSATCWPSTPTRSSPRWPTTSAPASTLTGADVARAYRQRTALSERMREFFGDHDVLVLPAAQVPPFPADQEFPTDDQRPADGDVPRLDARVLLDHRHRLPGDLGAVRAAPATGCPVGIQIVAPHGADRFLLEVAAAVEAAASTSIDSTVVRMRSATTWPSRSPASSWRKWPAPSMVTCAWPRAPGTRSWKTSPSRGWPGRRRSTP